VVPAASSRCRKDFPKGRIFLHFGAADQKAEVFLNGKKLCRHIGGYTAFSAELVGLEEGENVLTVARGGRGRGFAMRTRRQGRGLPWQSGLWQTVWCESVPRRYIGSLRLRPLFDEAALEITVEPGADLEPGDECTAAVEGRNYRFPSGEAFRLPLPGFIPWSPENPKLYDLVVTMGEDTVKSYFGMRKFDLAPDEQGIMRLFLNNAPYFHNGVILQSRWPGGFTQPRRTRPWSSILKKPAKWALTRCALPARWNVSAFTGTATAWECWSGRTCRPAAAFVRRFVRLRGTALRDGSHMLFGRRNLEGRMQYKREMREAAEQLRNHPSLALWTLFDEGRGQFDSESLAKYLNELDGERPIDRASGRYDQGQGPFRSLHVYKKPFRFVPDKKGAPSCSPPSAASVSEWTATAARKPANAASASTRPTAWSLPCAGSMRKKSVPPRRKVWPPPSTVSSPTRRREMDGLISFDRAS
jgi:hypothetical protein